MSAVPPPSRPLAIALAGLVSLAVAMGIGRFAFTPLLPMMLAERSVTLAGASLLASANYFGYLLGALACTFQPWIWRRLGASPAVNGPRLVRAGLVATALLTLGMALHVEPAWPVLRFLAGVASAVVFLYTSGWCLEQLARRGVPAMGALIYVGPGAGIVASGLAASALVAMEAPAAVGWATFAVLAAGLSASVWAVFDLRRGLAAPAVTGDGSSATTETQRIGPGYMAMLTVAYGLAGIGYIITATFLPVIARQALPGSPWLDLFWPLFGVGVMVGAIVASRLRAADLRLRLAACYAIQAAGVAASLVSPTLAGFAIGSLLLGLPFTAITFFGMQEVRRVRPRQATSYMGLLTAMYGVGQIAGPPLAAWLVAHSADAAQGFARSLWIACGMLVVGAGMYVVMARRP
ncbi:YbfB/YjiJ family MFS transporter [Ramlibacter sp. USB13]|uniref:YbfB/YjiJ family MFS transporter n=1 Tax=Ramlibacter cellulosilyticus TaxID=2764187 RepID=A0A923MQY0_9BURK|nr:YbfB/YjiJ family MFS transporter [Ramlibacter cellulosilyticus]MBC5783271.1 YbfB/YjiJ family MFS transporter [Ramlibacter cellulosilyticus]